MPIIDLTGHKYGRLTPIKPTGNKISGSMVWLCKCSCGNKKEVKAGHLRSGVIISCGCYNNEKRFKHGLKKTVGHVLWVSMRFRVNNNKRYIQKGIRVCKEWDEYIPFRKYVLSLPNAPTKEVFDTIATKSSVKILTLDRIDNDGHYTYGNIRWATYEQQNKNKGDSLFFNYRGRKLHISILAERMNIPATIVSRRYRNGWSIRRALTTPVDYSKAYNTNQKFPGRKRSK